jgi:hypothetical protein
MWLTDFEMKEIGFSITRNILKALCIYHNLAQSKVFLYINLTCFCKRCAIMIFQVDSAEKLEDIVTGNQGGPRLDSSCVIVHQPWATDQCVLSKAEQQLVGFCHKTLDEFPQRVIKLPVL